MKIFALCAASAAAFTAKPTDGKFCCLIELNFEIFEFNLIEHSILNDNKYNIE